MATFFTSDHHFGHQRIIELCTRPFSNVQEMDEVMVERWNEVVSPDDTVYHLGDLALGGGEVFERSMCCAARLNGRKLLVPGNHDRVFSKESKSRQARYRAVYEETGFTILPEQFEIVLSDGTRVLLCHFPPAGDSHAEDRYRTLRPVTGLPVIHGHTHQDDAGSGRLIHVGVDGREFVPVSEEQILRELDLG